VRVDEKRIRSLRMRAQRLTAPIRNSVPDVVRHLVGLQAQDTRMTRLLVRPRTSGVDAASVDRACQDASVVRTWAMRGTLHMVAADDLRWLVDLLGPIFIARSRTRRRQLGLPDDLCEDATDVMVELLAGRQLSRAALVEEIRARGVPVQGGQAHAHLVAYAAMRGVICRGPDRGNEPTYALVNEWVTAKGKLGPDEGLAELARRYLTAHGPAGVEDFATWSGLRVRQARRAIELVVEEFEEIATVVGKAWLRPDRRREPHARVALLLGHFDPYLLDYRNREFALDPAFAKRVQAGGGFIQPTVVVDGQVVGTWRQRRERERVTIDIVPFRPLGRAVLPHLEQEAADLGRYLHVDAVLRLPESG
jgi:Winged helix DNA-binding domain